MILPVSDSFILCGPTRFIFLPSHLVMESDSQGITDWRLNVSEPLSSAPAFLGNIHFLHSPTLHKPSSVMCHVLAKPLARLPLSFQLHLSLPFLRNWAKCSRTFHILFLCLFHATSLPKNLLLIVSIRMLSVPQSTSPKQPYSPKGDSTIILTIIHSLSLPYLNNQAVV